MRAFIAALALASALSPVAPPSLAATRATQHWGGPDFPISCDTVRAWRAEIEAMSPATRAALAAKFHITHKQRRQARACLKGQGS